MCIRDRYAEGIEGCREEFLSYRILYMGLHNMQIDLMMILKDTAGCRDHKAIVHVMRIVKAISNNNYSSLFKEYRNAPKVTKYLMNLFIDRLRIFALQTISMVYMTGVDLKYIADALAFESEKECREFVLRAGGVIGQNRLHCRPSIKNFKQCQILSQKIT
eukprot:TRINITY_DN10490_c0_g1_i8.p1 TRINITY_DN10490_c0_g1~~TRINITY_DN10490_c0_g1_i8.p1  ORF type:complete len:161 (-),score=37.52 TRINITY_DN10490_c0_g1_i8:71-553(-)